MTSCTSDSFTITELHESEQNIIHIDYVNLVGQDTDPVSFTCQGWKNPILRGEQSGFVLKTLDSGEYQIDEAENFSFDGSNLKKAPMGMDQIQYTSFVGLSGSLDGLKFSFKSGVNIQSESGCFVKFTVPLSVDFTGKSLDTIKASGMFVDSEGYEQTISFD